MITLSSHMNKILDNLETNKIIVKDLSQDSYDEFYELISELRLIADEIE